MRPDPVGQEPAPSTTAPAGSRDNRSRTLLPRSVVAREFARLFAEHDVATHPAEVRNLARRFVAAGHSELAEVEPYVLAYVDPTGERAVRNIMRGGAG